MTRSKLFRIVCILNLSFLIMACDASSDDPGIESGDKADGYGDPHNMPTKFGYDCDFSSSARCLQHNWLILKEKMPAMGRAITTPWAEIYWPHKDDGFNARWQGEDHYSPVELYDIAFNKWTPPEGFLKLKRFSHPGVAYDGAYYEQFGPAAKWAHQGTGYVRSEPGGNFLARRRTAPDGTLVDPDKDPWGGLQGWNGHCHAWAPASTHFPEPQHGVDYSGVRFEVSDIKALIMTLFDRGTHTRVGNTCEEKAIFDEHGRVVQDQCRDLNPGAFHIIVVNRIGRDRETLLMDKVYDDEYWNHPVFAYSISLQEEVTLEETLRLLNREDLINRAKEEATLAGEQGDAWKSRLKYPYNAVDRIQNGGRFVHVKLDLQYVTETSSPSKEPRLPEAENYFLTENYAYVLELSKDGKILGGEWITQDNHPDYLWQIGDNDWGTVYDNNGTEGNKAIIKFETIKKLVELSTQPNP